MRRSFALAAGALALFVWFAAEPMRAQSTSRPQARPAAAAPLYYPGPHGDWQRRPAAEVGMNEAAVKDAVAFAVASESKSPRDLAVDHYLVQAREPYDTPVGLLKPRGPASGVIVRHGYLVAEWGEPARVDMTFSVTKSFVSTTVGLAYDRGLIKDLNERVQQYVSTGEFDSEHNRKITWDHLLRQTSDWQGTLWGKPDWADRPEGEASTWMTRNAQRTGQPSTSTTTCA